MAIEIEFSNRTLGNVSLYKTRFVIEQDTRINPIGQTTKGVTTDVDIAKKYITQYGLRSIKTLVMLIVDGVRTETYIEMGKGALFNSTGVVWNEQLGQWENEFNQAVLDYQASLQHYIDAYDVWVSNGQVGSYLQFADGTLPEFDGDNPSGTYDPDNDPNFPDTNNPDNPDEDNPSDPDNPNDPNNPFQNA